MNIIKGLSQENWTWKMVENDDKESIFVVFWKCLTYVLNLTVCAWMRVWEKKSENHVKCGMKFDRSQGVVKRWEIFHDLEPLDSLQSVKHLQRNVFFWVTLNQQWPVYCFLSFELRLIAQICETCNISFLNYKKS